VINICLERSRRAEKERVEQEARRELHRGV
jgi:hypothetical protein